MNNNEHACSVLCHVCRVKVQQLPYIALHLIEQINRSHYLSLTSFTWLIEILIWADDMFRL